MKKFFGEFKKFITRGNVLDMAVGVIVGGAFTGIVNGLSNYILKPLINWLLAFVLGKEGLSGAITPLSMAYKEDGTFDLANSIYIDWGAFISAVINFFLIALVLFTIVRIMNRIKEENNKIKASIEKGKLTKADKKALKQKGIKLSNREGVKEYLEEKRKAIQEQEEAAKKEAEEKARLEREQNPTTEDLLKDILETLKQSR